MGLQVKGCSGVIQTVTWGRIGPGVDTPTAGSASATTMCLPDPAADGHAAEIADQSAFCVAPKRRNH